MIDILHGDCLDEMDFLRDLGIQVDSVVTDPPYHLQSIHKRFAKVGRDDKTWSRSGPHQRTARGFMNQQWDGGDIAFRPEMWRLCFDLLKPGGHLLAFSGTRTYHRMACAIEDAGFEIRDCIQWLYGSGFPKSHNVALDYEKEICDRFEYAPDKWAWFYKSDGQPVRTSAPFRSALANEWEGWGTALKPACEPICVARKPLIGTVAANVQQHGTGALNIDGCRVPADGRPLRVGDYKQTENNVYEGRMDGSLAGGSKAVGTTDIGRWPANIIHDGSDEVLEAFAAYGADKGAAAPASGKTLRQGNTSVARGKFNGLPDGQQPAFHADTGTAARFFYCAKASKKDRAGSKHPTVKPIALLRYLCRLVTPPGGTVLDPFAGSGTTLQAAIEEGFRAIGIEREAEYVADIRRRKEIFS